MYIFPLEDLKAKITSMFSLSRKNPVTGVVQPHHGIDYAVPEGTRVYAINSGVVIHSGIWGTGGLTVRVRHSDNKISEYLHNSKLLVKVGDSVKQGQAIALSGNTGNSTGPHLHFGVYDEGQKKYINPLEVIKKADVEQGGYFVDLLSRVNGQETNINDRVVAEVERIYKNTDFLYIALGVVALVISADYMVSKN
jgi:murein DD-endopeptidase MepM/ murein hydrolase activator NlpD